MNGKNEFDGMRRLLAEKHKESGGKVAAQNVSFFDTPEGSRKRDPATLPHIVTVREWQDLLDDVVKAKDTAWVASVVAGVALALSVALLISRFL